MIFSYDYKNKYLIYDSKKNKIFFSKFPISKTDLEKNYNTMCYMNSQTDDKIIYNENIQTIFITYISSPFCNMACTYCYEKDSLIQENLKIISAEQHMNIYVNTLSKYPNSKISICFFGGEPFIAFDEIYKFLLLLENYCIQNNKEFPYIAAITNGTIYNSKIDKILNLYFKGITFSLDGTNIINDKYRMYKNGEGTFNDIYRNIKNINKSKKYEINCEVTVTDAYLQNYSRKRIEDIWALFKELQFSVLDFICVIGNKNDDFTIKDEQKLEVLAKDIVDIWYDDLIYSDQIIKVPKLVNFLALIVANRKLDKIRCAAGLFEFAFDSKNNIYPCQAFVGENDYIIGHTNKNELILFPQENRKNFISDKEFNFCTICNCQNGCSSFCYAIMKNHKNELPSSCIFNQMIFKYSLIKIVDLMDSPFKQNFIKGVKKIVSA